MGLDKFLKDEKEEVVLSKKNYKSKVNEMVKNTFEKESLNLLNMESEEVSTKKVPMSIYFNKEDLDLLKAIAFEKNTTKVTIRPNILIPADRFSFMCLLLLPIIYACAIPSFSLSCDTYCLEIIKRSPFVSFTSKRPPKAGDNVLILSRFMIVDLLARKKSCFGSSASSSYKRLLVSYTASFA